ncbi:MAG: DUF6328 family protein [Ilumatobacteraceae bacterium]
MSDDHTTPGRPGAALDARVDPDEEARERYRELLEELRTIIPGVQVLFGFLLTVPFSARFDRLDDLGRDLYSVVLAGVALAIVVFLTPAAIHRFGADGDRARRLRIGVRTAVAGMTLLATSMTIAVFVVARFVFSTRFAIVVSAIVAVAFVVCWGVLAFGRRAAHDP